MSKNNLFESDDIYDFDYLNESSQKPSRPKFKGRETLAVPDNRVKLPPVLVGRNVAAIQEAKKAKLAMRSMARSVILPESPDKDWHKERLKLKGPRQPLKEARIYDIENPWHKTRLPHIYDVTAGYRDPQWVDATANMSHYQPQAFSGTRSYQQQDQLNMGYVPRSHDQVLQDDFNGKVQKALELSKAAGMTGHNRPTRLETDSIVVDKGHQKSETIDVKQQPLRWTQDIYKGEMRSDMVPKPPIAVKPALDDGYSKSRRRLRYHEDTVDQHQTRHEDKMKGNAKSILTFLSSTEPEKTQTAQMSESTMFDRPRGPRVRFTVNTELNQDVSVHNDPKPYYKPRPNTPYEIDYDEEIKQATALAKDLDEFHESLRKGNVRFGDGNASMLGSHDVGVIEKPRNSSFNQAGVTRFYSNTDDVGVRQSTSSNVVTSGLVGSPSDSVVHLQSQSRQVPELSWNGEHARRGAGFVSKVKDQGETRSNTSVNTQIPEKIRKQMRRYFN